MSQLDANRATGTGTLDPNGPHVGLDMSDGGTIWIAWTTLAEIDGHGLLG